MSKQNQEFRHKAEVKNICLSTEIEKQSNKAYAPVISLFVYANVLAVALGTGISEIPKPTKGYISERIEIAKIEYPIYEVGIIEPKKDTENTSFGKTKRIIELNETIQGLQKEVEVLKNRLKNSLPVHTMTYMVVNSICATIAGTLLVLRFCLDIYTVDPYYLICTLIIAGGLFLTAWVSLKDWKDCLVNGKKQKGQ